jgi:hypothetical protein
LYPVIEYIIQQHPTKSKEKVIPMASKYKPVCETVFPWLRTNLGKHALAGLTGTDYKALRAAAQIVELWACGGNAEDCFRAFGAVVRQMQGCTRFAAFYCVAHVANWGDCLLFWSRAGLPAIRGLPRCQYDLHGEAWVSVEAFEAAAVAVADRAAGGAVS